MLYKILLSDNSFIIADENYILTLFKNFRKVKIAIKDYLIQNKYRNFYMIDLINNKKLKRTFKIIEIENSEFPIGSRIKFAQDIKENDLVIGVNGQPQRVKELHTGTDDMFEISINGTNYVVNGGHILALVDRNTGEHIEIPVNVFMHMNEEFRSNYVMERVIN